MNGLMVHCGGFETKREDVLAVPQPLLTATRNRTKLVGYGDFLDMIDGACKAENVPLRWDDARYALADGSIDGTKVPGGKLFGVVPIGFDGANLPDFIGDWTAQIGFRQSYDSSMSAGLVLGQRVFVCDNMCFSGEFQIAAKNTLEVYDVLPQRLREAAAKMLGWIKGISGEVKLMKQIHPSAWERDSIFCEAVRRGVLPGSKLGAILKSVNEPEYEYDETPNGNPSIWRLFNAATEAQRDRSPLQQFRTGGGLLNVFREHGIRARRETLTVEQRKALEEMEFETAAVYAEDVPFSEN